MFVADYCWSAFMSGTCNLRLVHRQALRRRARDDLVTLRTSLLVKPDMELFSSCHSLCTVNLSALSSF